MKRIVPFLVIIFMTAFSVSAQNDTLEYRHRPFQFTFMFPPLSTNGVDNVRIVNDFSLNLFVGLSGGVEVFEAGSFINVDRFYVRGVQLAGFGNTVGGSADGVQLAGFYNVNGAGMTGFQGAGFANVNGAGMTGFQGAGFMNVVGNDMNGAQAAGFMNIAGGRTEGFQGAGFLNIAEEPHNGVQAAGFGNVAAGGNTYFQGAGFFNVAGKVEGVQAAGFLNIAGTVKGVQLSGFINVCDSIDGVPLGVINVVRKNGYRKLGFSVSEVQYANISFRLGVRHLYNIFSFGKPFGPGNRWMYGGGLGTELGLTEKSTLSIEATVHQETWIPNPVSNYLFYTDRLNMYQSLRILFGREMDHIISLHVGPTFNIAVANSNPDLGTEPWHEIAPYSIFNHTSNNYRQTNVQMWFGLQGEIRF
jgi:hypothetical protein